MTVVLPSGITVLLSQQTQCLRDSIKMLIADRERVNHCITVQWGISYSYLGLGIITKMPGPASKNYIQSWARHHTIAHSTVCNLGFRRRRRQK